MPAHRRVVVRHVGELAKRALENVLIVSGMGRGHRPGLPHDVSATQAFWIKRHQTFPTLLLLLHCTVEEVVRTLHLSYRKCWKCTCPGYVPNNYLDDPPHAVNNRHIDSVASFEALIFLQCRLRSILFLRRSW